MKRKGIETLHFGKIDKTDFLIPPFILFYFYTIFAAAFDLPNISKQVFFDSEIVAWIGVFSCLIGLVMLVWSLISFSKSFRIGIDTEQPDKLITSGVFAVSRNPIYVGLWLVFVGQFLIFPNWIPLIYLSAVTWLFHRQVLREEDFLKVHYGEEYAEYCDRVRRYL
jgi:protein-S-isoprenylcysteine O-methyltransferase Ste14